MTKNTDPNYIEYGSPEHLRFLGLRKATEKDKIQFDGYALEDITKYPSNARPDYLEEVIKQKLSEWKTKPVMPQSRDFRQPGYAPPIFDPNPGERSDIPGVKAVVRET